MYRRQCTWSHASRCKFGEIIIISDKWSWEDYDGVVVFTTHSRVVFLGSCCLIYRVPLFGLLKDLKGTLCKVLKSHKESDSVKKVLQNVILKHLCHIYTTQLLYAFKYFPKSFTPSSGLTILFIKVHDSVKQTGSDFAKILVT